MQNAKCKMQNDATRSGSGRHVRGEPTFGIPVISGVRLRLELIILHFAFCILHLNLWRSARIARGRSRFSHAGRRIR
jgi:hypothetical protein